MKLVVSLAALAAAAFSAQVHAGDEGDGASSNTGGSSSVTIYGFIDQGVEYIHDTATSKTTTGNATRIGSGTATSYLGFRGREDLGGGLRAIFNLEQGYSPDLGTQSQGPRAWGRQAYVGLEGSFGLLTLGRQYTMKAFAMSPINMFGTGAQGLPTLDEGVSNPRADNAISYRVKFGGGFETGANYSFGRDGLAGNSKVATNCPGETTEASQCREWSLLLKYDGDKWGVSSAYERQNGGTSATYGGLTSPDLHDTRTILGGYLFFGGTKVSVGWIRRQNDGLATPKSDLAWIMSTIPVTTAFSIDLMLAELNYKDSADKADVLGLRGQYALSKRTALYITADYINNGGALAVGATTNAPAVAPLPGGTQLSLITGFRHAF